MFIPFSYYEAAANLLTNPALDPFGKIPELKYCAVKVMRGGELMPRLELRRRPRHRAARYGVTAPSGSASGLSQSTVVVFYAARADLPRPAAARARDDAAGSFMLPRRI